MFGLSSRESHCCGLSCRVVLTILRLIRSRASLEVSTRMTKSAEAMLVQSAEYESISAGYFLFRASSVLNLH